MKPLHPALAPSPAAAPAPAGAPLPDYLERVYWWAYVRPWAIGLFERAWLVNLILFGNYGPLRDGALRAIVPPAGGRVLQVACVYGDLSARLLAALPPDARLDVVDIVPRQIQNLARKLPPDGRVRLLCADARRLPHADASVERVLLFFLLHEQPDAVRLATVREALRVVRPGGRLVIVDYHRPAWWHPLRPLMRVVFDCLEPFARGLCARGLEACLPPGAAVTVLRRTLRFGGLYEQLELQVA